MNQFYALYLTMLLSSTQVFSSSLPTEFYDEEGTNEIITYSFSEDVGHDEWIERHQIDTYFLCPTGAEVSAWIKRASQRDLPRVNQYGERRHYSGHGESVPKDLTMEEYKAWLRVPDYNYLQERAEIQSAMPYPCYHLPEGAHSKMDFKHMGATLSLDLIGSDNSSNRTMSHLLALSDIQLSSIRMGRSKKEGYSNTLLLIYYNALNQKTGQRDLLQFSTFIKNVHRIDVNNPTGSQVITFADEVTEEETEDYNAFWRTNCPFDVKLSYVFDYEKTHYRVKE